MGGGVTVVAQPPSTKLAVRTVTGRTRLAGLIWKERRPIICPLRTTSAPRGIMNVNDVSARSMSSFG